MKLLLNRDNKQKLFKLHSYNKIDMHIPQEKLERYSHFVSLNSTNGVYEPEKGLEALLSSVTPDPKVIVIIAMAANKNEYFYSPRRLQSAVFDQLNSLDINARVYPISYFASWSYCEFRDRYGSKQNGSLVDIGAVVKRANMDTPEGLKTGYQISTEGVKLAVPIGLAAIDFVWKATHSRIGHKYDSMSRLLGSVFSRTEHRRQLGVYYVVKFLIENEGNHRSADISVALDGILSDGLIHIVLNTLSEAGIIDYESPLRDVNGARPKGFVKYCSTQKQPNLDSAEIYKRFRERNPTFHGKSILYRIINHINENPSSAFEAHQLNEKLKINNISYVVRVLSFLADLGSLEREDIFQGGRKFSNAGANDLTKMFYEGVLLPAWYSATTLTPYKIEIVDLSEKVSLFLENYHRERSRKGPEGGEEVRQSIIRVLSASHSPLKFSHIRQEVNEMIGRNLSIGAVKGQVKQLMENDVIISPKKRYYDLRTRN